MIDIDSEDDGDYIDMVGSSDYIYSKNNIKYDIGVKNYIFDNPAEKPAIISNYIFNNKNEFCIFATIVWEDIQYVDEDYNPYNYDPDPVMVIYRDDLPKEKEEIYLTIINELCAEYYDATSHFKHFDPKLPKIKLSEFTDKSRGYIKEAFEELINHYDSLTN